MNIKKILYTGGIVNILEWYDYSLFLTLITTLGEKFFPPSDARAVLLSGFLVFAIGYIARPLGGVFWGIVGDKRGRKKALRLSLLCMALPTTLMGVAPTYQSIGIAATMIMIIARILQGLAMGGALTSSISFIIEHTPHKYRGLVGSIPMCGICIGILLGSFTVFAIKSILTMEQFDAFGWRIPFLLGIVVLFVSSYIKTSTTETPVFQNIIKQNTIDSAPFKHILQHYKKDVLTGIFINATGSVMFYFAIVNLPQLLKINGSIAALDVDTIINHCYILMIFVIIICGHLSTIVGRRNYYIGLLILIIILMPYILYNLEIGINLVLSTSLTAALAAAYIAPEPVFMTELYPARVRNTAMALSYGIGTAVFGGATPYIIGTLLEQSNGHIFPNLIWYINGIAFCGLITIIQYKEKAQIS